MYVAFVVGQCLVFVILGEHSCRPKCSGGKSASCTRCARGYYVLAAILLLSIEIEALASLVPKQADVIG